MTGALGLVAWGASMGNVRMKTIARSLKDFQQAHAPTVVAGVGIVIGVWLALAKGFGWADEPFTRTDVVVALTFFLVLDIAYVISNSLRPSGVRVSRDQDTDIGELTRLLEELKINRDWTADLLEHSAFNALDLIKFLKKHRCRMRILIKHPDTVAGSKSEERIRTNLNNLLGAVLANNPDRYEIRCYRSPASVRGRLIGRRVINIGWYTPNLVDPELDVLGDTNPIITAQLGTTEGNNLARMFEGVFRLLWDDAVPAERVVDQRATRSTKTRRSGTTSRSSTTQRVTSRTPRTRRPAAKRK
jgi:hypothetical protein